MATNSSLWSELRDQGRATVSAFAVVGVSYLYTMESWWHAWQLDMFHLLTYTVAGLAVVLLLARTIGFHKENERDAVGGNDDGGGGAGGDEDAGSGRAGDGDGGRDGGEEDGRRGGRGDEDGSGRGVGTVLYETVTDATEAVAQSFVAAYVVLFLFGVLTLDDSPATVARLGVFHVVPLGFGAALANDLFAGEGSEQPSRAFAKTVGVFALGAIFLSAPIALTQEMELLASYAGWWRLAALVVATLLVTHLTLFELETRGQARRVRGLSKWMQVGHTFVVYVVGVAVAVGLLAAFGHFDGQPLSVWVQQTVVLSFPTSVGASAAEVIV